MLQRKLLTRLGFLVMGFVTGAVVSIVLLQGVLKDLDHMSADATAMVDGARDLGSAVEAIAAQAERVRQHADGEALAEIDRQQAAAALLLERLATFPPLGSSPALASVRSLLPGFAAGARTGTQPLAADLRRDTIALGALARQHVARAQAAVSSELRYLIVGLCAAALVMMNLTIIVLLRTANMILRPVGELVEASRELASEHFDYRVRTDQADEFGELARAYNSLAGQLRANEHRKVEALQHLAVTLNHEVNNAINTIDLQLSLMDRRSGGDPGQRRQLQGIHENLRRITGTIASLKHVRRVVLTDYAPGEKMIDLERSVADDAPSLAGDSGHAVADVGRASTGGTP